MPQSSQSFYFVNLFLSLSLILMFYRTSLSNHGLEFHITLISLKGAIWFIIVRVCFINAVETCIVWKLYLPEVLKECSFGIVLHWTYVDAVVLTCFYGMSFHCVVYNVMIRYSLWYNPWLCNLIWSIYQYVIQEGSCFVSRSCWLLYQLSKTMSYLDSTYCFVKYNGVV